MEYTILKLAKIANISTRTLRYYDEIGILKPKRISSSGYRIYGSEEVDILQQILFYRQFGLELTEIKDILNNTEFSRINALRDHKKKLYEKREQIDILIKNIEKTIAAGEGRTIMSDNEKFEGFKQKLIDENEEKYGEEIREKYGKETVEKSNQKIKNMTKEQYDKISGLAAEINLTLAQAYKTGNPAGELAQKAVLLHKEWLCFYWDKYSIKAHAALGQMYVDDERFKKYYDDIHPGCAEFLRDAILIYAKK
ncbi:MAG: MerR family transcriptional regulator [Eubacteriaceae bacterium]|nr:MerR family transcriptional regulator [Eubacteriaceae bacterium]